MKKVLLPVALFATIGFTSCGGGSKALAIDVPRLETACDCGDAALTIAVEMNTLVEEVGEEEPSIEQDELFDKLEDKMEEVEGFCKKEKGFKKKEMKKCASFIEAMEIMKEL